MIKEFAVDPREVVRSYADLKYIVEKFGISEGRVISRFPKKWLKSAYDAAKQLHGGKVEYKKIEEKLRKIPKSALLSLGRPGGEGGADWFDLAIAEHRRHPFDYILSPSLDEGSPCVLLEDFEADHPCLRPAHDREIRREAAVMAEACGLLLRAGRHIKLVDPHFDFQHRRFVNPFLAFLQKVGPAAIEIHRGDNISHEVLRQHADRYLPRVLPEDVIVQMFTWPAEPMHNRFILTELGGVAFSNGLDEFSPGKNETDYVSLMSEDTRCSHWGRYSGGDLVGRWPSI